MDPTNENNTLTIRDCEADVLRVPITYVQADHRMVYIIVQKN